MRRLRCRIHSSPCVSGRLVAQALERLDIADTFSMEAAVYGSSSSIFGGHGFGCSPALPYDEKLLACMELG